MSEESARHPVRALPTASNWGRRLAFSLAVLTPSAGLFHKYLGGAGAALVGGVGVLIFLLAPVPSPRPVGSKARVVGATAATVVALAALVVWIHPLASAGVEGGGSDRDEALSLATTELLHGRYPYGQLTYLGNPISPLPGALLLAVPFVVVGAVALQSVPWLLAFVLGAGAALRDRGSALLLLWVVLVASPVVMHELVTGGDLVANAIYVLLAMSWLVHGTEAPHPSSARMTLRAAAFGLALASRAHFLLVLPLVLAALRARGGLGLALRSGATTVAVFLAATVPFYLHDPAAFSPLHTANKLARFDSTLPGAGWLVPLGAVLLSLLLARRVGPRWSALLARSAVVLAFPIASAVLLDCLDAGRPILGSAGHGISFLFCGALAFWADVLERRSQRPDAAPAATTR